MSLPAPERCTDPHDCGRYLPHHAECCPCAGGMSERWADAANRLLRVAEAATDLLWKATQYGETEDGDTAAYILPKGTVHRLVGAMQGAGFPVALRAASQTSTGVDDAPADRAASPSARSSSDLMGAPTS